MNDNLQKKVEEKAVNSESGYTTTNDSSGSEANSLNSATSCYSNHSQNSPHLPTNNILTYPSANLPTTTNQHTMQSSDLDDSHIVPPPPLPPHEGAKVEYADAEMLLRAPAVTGEAIKSFQL